MYARVTFTSVKAGKMDDYIKAMRDYVLPGAREQKGFESALYLVSRELGKGINAAVWDTEADMLANEKNDWFRQQVVTMMEFIKEPPTVEYYDTVTQARGLYSSEAERTAMEKIRVRVTHLTFKRDKVDEQIRWAGEVMVSAIEEQKGFVSAWYLDNRKTGKGIGLALWNTEADMMASEKNQFYLQGLDRFIGRLKEPPTREYYEVIAQA